MRENKALYGLSKLTIYEINHFRKYLQSPYFNANEYLIALFEYYNLLLKSNPKDIEVDKEEAWHSVYGAQQLDNQKFLKLNSDLVMHLENFLAHEELDKMETFKNILKISGAHKHKIRKWYKGLINQAHRNIKIDKNQSKDIYLYKFLLERQIFDLNIEGDKISRSKTPEYDVEITQLTKNLDIYYIAEKLYTYATYVSALKRFKIETTIDHIDWVKETSHMEQYLNNDIISSFQTIYKTYEEENNIENFNKIKEIIKNDLYLFPENEVKQIFETAFSFAVNRINKGDFSFQMETFELYKSALDNKIILIDNIISPTTFININGIALRVKEFKWAQNFINNYAQNLPEDDRENTVEFSLARLEFYKNNFGRVLEHISRVNYQDSWNALDSKTLQLAAYYELKEYDALESLFQSFKAYLKREKSIPKNRKQNYLNLIKYTDILIRTNRRDKDKIQKLKDEVTHTPGIVSKLWLLQKIDEL